MGEENTVSGHAVIRFVNSRDAKRVNAIYNQAVRAGNATAHLKELDLGQTAAWLLDHKGDTHPMYVLEVDGLVIGWGTLSPWRKGREGLAAAAEISYYLDYEYHGQGYGRMLVRYILDDCSRLGIENLLAVLLEPNQASIALLEKMGFNLSGRLPAIACLKGLVCDQLIYSRRMPLAPKLPKT